MKIEECSRPRNQIVKSYIAYTKSKEVNDRVSVFKKISHDLGYETPNFVRRVIREWKAKGFGKTA